MIQRERQARQRMSARKYENSCSNRYLNGRWMAKHIQAWHKHFVLWSGHAASWYWRGWCTHIWSAACHVNHQEAKKQQLEFIATRLHYFFGRIRWSVDMLNFFFSANSMNTQTLQGASVLVSSEPMSTGWDAREITYIFGYIHSMYYIEHIDSVYYMYSICMCLIIIICSVSCRKKNIYVQI